MMPGSHNSQEDREHETGRTWFVGAVSICPDGRKLLRRFAEMRPRDYGFVEFRDFMNPSSSAFDGIPEWDAFLSHFAGCGSCRV